MLRFPLSVRPGTRTIMGACVASSCKDCAPTNTASLHDYAIHDRSGTTSMFAYKISVLAPLAMPKTHSKQIEQQAHSTVSVPVALQ